MRVLINLYDSLIIKMESSYVGYVGLIFLGRWFVYVFYCVGFGCRVGYYSGVVFLFCFGMM